MLGFAAKEFIGAGTNGKTITITFNEEIDDFKRRMATIAADGVH